MLKIKRYQNNPILTPSSAQLWGMDEQRNPGVVFDGHHFHMLFTASTNMRQGGDMVLGYAKSGDGVNFEIAEEPFIKPSTDFNDFDYGTVEDTRVTELEGKYYIAYAGRSQKIKDFAEGKRRLGPDGNINPTWTENFRRVGLAVTEDWQSVDKLGPVTSEHMSDANVALFPERINGKYVYLHRPTPCIPWALSLKYSPACIWINFANDLGKWSSDNREMPWNMTDGVDIPNDHLLIKPEYKWEELKVGGSGVPIPTDDGWLMFYHAVDRAGVYRVGLMLLDRENPCKVIARSEKPIMEPRESYELEGRYPKCIFPCANVVIDDNILMYYGAVDIHTCLATLKLQEALDYVLQFRKKTVIAPNWKRKEVELCV
jgi:beta-1,2-mannobiose phosphorylase / 1,2-beta-oligomannan phosphorylase